MGIILLIVAIVLGFFLMVIGFFFGLLRALFLYVDPIALLVAEGIDRIGNVVCADLFNACLIKKHGYKFGNIKETVSRVLGINKKLGNLSKMGVFFADLLNKIDKNHVEKASKEYWKEELIISDFNDNELK